jgi:N utilization substance protein B
MGARRKARKRALDVLFESELRRLPVGATLAERLSAEPPPNPYTVELVNGVVEHIDRIDALVSAYAQGWAMPRMPAVDRNLLRIAAFELLYVPDVPPAVVISEAVDLAQQLSTDQSAAFVNGVLARLAELERGGEAVSTDSQRSDPESVDPVASDPVAVDP